MTTDLLNKIKNPLEELDSRPNFFVGSTNNTPSPQIEIGLKKENIFKGSNLLDSGCKEMNNNRCCENDCRSRKKSIIKDQAMEEENEISTLILNENKKKPRFLIVLIIDSNKFLIRLELFFFIYEILNLYYKK